MKIPHVCLILTALAILAPGPAFAQTPEKCPVVWLDGPTGDVAHGSPIVFSAQLTHVNATERPEFRWETSAGTIMSGQGTSSITVDTAGLGGVTVTARVIVSGIVTTCPMEAARSANIYPEGIGCALRFDNYGDIEFEDEKARLDNFAIQLSQSETATGYVFVYAGRSTYEGEASDHLLRARQYLVEYRKIPADRVIAVDGGYMEELETTLIIAPKDATPPVAMPTLSPSEVELTKPRPRARSKKHKIEE
jgi:hypothetical protein